MFARLLVSVTTFTIITSSESKGEHKVYSLDVSAFRSVICALCLCCMVQGMNRLNTILINLYVYIYSCGDGLTGRSVTSDIHPMGVVKAD